MDYKALIDRLIKRSKADESGNSFATICSREDLKSAATAITDLLARAEAAEAEVSELRKRLAEAEAACAYHKYRRGEVNTSTRGLALTAYGLRQKLAEVEAQKLYRDILSGNILKGE